MKMFFVLGPEGSGTKLVTELLTRVGAYGHHGHDQPLDDYIDNPEKMDAFGDWLRGSHEYAVFRRSYPHGDENPDIPKIVKALKSISDELMVVVTFRSWPTNEQSQIHLKQHAEDRKEARMNMENAYKEILYQIRRLKLDYTMVSFGDMLRNKTATLHYFFNYLGIDYQPNIDLEAYIDPDKENVRVREYREQAGV